MYIVEQARIQEFSSVQPSENFWQGKNKEKKKMSKMEGEGEGEGEGGFSIYSALVWSKCVRYVTVGVWGSSPRKFLVLMV